MRFTKKLTSIVLALCMLLSVASVGVVTASAEDTAYETYAQASIRGSNILHCFNWSYNQIKANLSEIAKAGYTAVQTSPVQSPKDYNSSWTDTPNQWWKLYQPLGFSISDGNTWLGTKAQLTSLCTEADKYGIKVVVDIVANHLANNGTDGGTYSYINSGVESDLKNANYYHTNNTRTNDDNRYNITQYHLGMPDLNTGNSYIQQRALGLLEECIDCGVDGFRFDAAKHIELPTDPSNCRSNFWPTVINGATSYAQQNGKETPFYYGEILGGAGTDISNYTQYMAVTDNYTGDLALDKAYWAYAPDLANGAYHKGASASDSVLWVESHDTYMGESGSAWTKNTSSVESNIINRAWAIVGARAESTALFFARPNSSMGYASTDGNWKSKAVAEINKFKNHFAGTNEYLANSGDKVAYIERGTKGVVISKLDGGGQVNLTAHQMEDGTYTDYVTGGTFTVSNGVISGNVDSQGVAVVYNAQDSAGNFIEADTLYLDPGISSWKQSGKRYAMYVFNSSSSAWVSMADTDSDGIFEAAVPTGDWTGVIFCTMNASDSTNSWENKINQTVDLFPTDGNDLFTVTGADSGDSTKYNGTWSVYSPQEEETTQPTTSAPSDTYTIYAVNNAGWSNMSVHYWGGSSTQWPGAPMTSYSGSKVYTFELPKNVDGIVFSDGNGSNTKQTSNITTGFADGAIWVIGSASKNNYPVSAAPTYYLVGTINNWSHRPDCAFSIIASDSGKLEYKLSNVQLPANAELKVHSSSDAWYPGGANYTVAAAGIYDIYFRPNGDGNSDWHENYFYLVNVTPCAVTWKNYDGTVLDTETYTYGETPTYKGEAPQKPADLQNTYTFTGWSPEPAAVTGDITYTAQFESSSNTYNVTWKNYNGTVLDTETYAYGETPTYKGEAPTKPADAQYTYNFSGWSPAITEVTTDAAYTAQFSETVNTYTVTWQDEDGSLLGSETYAYGETPTYKGATPSKPANAQYTYTFNGWVPVVASVSGDVTYKATYSQTVNTYTVTWKNGDDTLKTETYEYGETPTYKGEAPQKPADLQNTYTFSGWSPEITDVAADATYTAAFTSTPAGTYTITVNNAIGWDDVYVYYWLGGENNSWPGEAMTAGNDGITYTATIPATAEAIIFNNGDTSDMKQTADITTGIEDGAHWVVCNYNNTITVNTVPTYYLVGTITDWSTDNAQTFAPIKNPDGLEEYKLTATLAANDEIKVYGSDDKWYPGGANYTVTADGAYDVYFRPNGDGNSDWYQKYIYLANVTPCTVTWKNYDDTVLDTETYTYGETPTYKGEAPTKPADLQNTYTFTGWSPEPAAVTGDIAYTAQYTPTAHNWQVSWTWNGYQSADAHFSCTDCAMTTDKAAAITSVTTAPTMTVAGSVVYTATVTGPDGQTYTDSKTEVLPATAVHLAGHSISLDGDIAVNFYMELDSALANSQTAYMQFYVPDTSPEYQDQKVYVKDLTPIEQGGKTYYVFKCRVAAKDMDAQISAQLINGDDVSYTYTYSVREYANYLLDHLDVPQYAAAANLVREMLTYGDNANVYFDETAEALAPSNTVIPEYTSTVASFADSIFNGASLSLKSKTTLSLFFKSSSDLTISMQGKTEDVDYELQHVGNDYVIRIRNIPVFDLDKPITVQVNGEDAVSYSPLTYCFKVQDSSNVKLANTVKALYNYWLAAKSYFGGIEPEVDETEKL